MKPQSLLSALALSILLLPAVGAVERHFGEPFGDATEVRLSELMAEPEAYVGKRVRIEGLVEDVCPMKGCWISILDQQSAKKVRFKVEDDVIVFPAEAKGHQVVAEGILRAKRLDQEQARGWFAHLAEERGETFDPETITGPQTIYEIEGIAASMP